MNKQELKIKFFQQKEYKIPDNNKEFRMYRFLINKIETIINHNQDLKTEAWRILKQVFQWAVELKERLNINLTQDKVKQEESDQLCKIKQIISIL